MTIHVFKGRNFRRFRAFHLECHPRFNVITGPNGAGKTSLLEAIYVLSRGKSFRTTRRHRLWRHGEDSFSLRAELSDALGRILKLKLDADAQGLNVRLQDEPIRVLSTISPLLPVQLLDPRETPLVAGSPRDRRRFLDWGLFHVEPRFHHHWQMYERALGQRNAALRAAASESVLIGWEKTMITHGEELDEMRRAYLADLMPLMDAYRGKLACTASLECRYQPGWPRERSFAESMRSHRSKDRLQGFCSMGPHRADIDIRIDGVAAAHHLSRGEEKRWTYAFLLAQIAYMKGKTDREPIVLIDDPVSDLDEGHWSCLSELLTSLPAQQFITLIDSRHLPKIPEYGLFHVEQEHPSRMV